MTAGGDEESSSGGWGCDSSTTCEGWAEQVAFRGADTGDRPGRPTGGTCPALSNHWPNQWPNLPNHWPNQSAKAHQTGGKPTGSPAIGGEHIFVRTDSPNSAPAPPTSALLLIPLFTLAGLSASPLTSDFSNQTANC